MSRRRRQNRSLALLTALLAAAGMASTATAVPERDGARNDAATCQASAPGGPAQRGRDHSVGSLPPGGAGPDVLTWPRPRAPQLENTEPWVAEPILVSGASAYRDGEFLYQDWLYDDAGAGYSYPTAPEYAGNAADLVEVRLRLVDDGTLVRVTFNTMLDPELVATTLALGSSGATYAVPHGANTVAPGEVFVTAHGSDGDAVAAATGEFLAPIAVSSDAERRQVTVCVPFAVFDPRADTAVRVAAAAGLWDAAAGTYRAPEPAASASASASASAPAGATTSAPSAFFNAAFRYDEPLGESFRNTQQTDVIASGDLSPLFAEVDFVALADGVDNDRAGQRGGVPTSGVLNRIYASRFETRRGSVRAVRSPMPRARARRRTRRVRSRTSGASRRSARRSSPASSRRSAVRPVPSAADTWVRLHAADPRVQPPVQRLRRRPDRQLHRVRERGAGSVVATPQNRGVCHWQFDQAAADTYEVWADVARHYPLDAGWTAIAGESLGGYATWKNAVQFPDLYAAAGPTIGSLVPAASYPGPPAPPPGPAGTAIYPLLGSLRHVPTIHFSGIADPLVPIGSAQPASEALEGLGYRHSFWRFAGHHNLLDLAPMGEYFGERRVERDPAHVTYVVDAALHQPEVGITSDAVYWLSRLRLRDSEALLGTIDVRSHGFGTDDPQALRATGSASVRDAAPDGSAYPATTTTTEWDDPPQTATADALDVVARNIGAVTIDVDRARVSCDAHIDVDSDGPVEVRLVGASCPLHVVRHSGPDRIATAVAVSQAAFTTATTVVLARADDYADALTGVALAVQERGPLLLTPRDRLPGSVVGELARLGAHRVLVMGGEAAVAPELVRYLEVLGVSVERVAGSNRFATAAAAARRLYSTPARVFLSRVCTPIPRAAGLTRSRRRRWAR